MRSVTMCFSLLQLSRTGIPKFTEFWRESFHNLNRPYKSNSHFKILDSKTYNLEGGYTRRWLRKPISTKNEGRRKSAAGKKGKARDEILESEVSASATLNINRAEVIAYDKAEYCDIQQRIEEIKDLSSLVTLIVFDIETTGFSRANERVIEIAFQDLSGGENGTFQTLVNPGRLVPNSHIHGITTHMVSRPEVPRMQELIPIMLQYIRSRQKPGGYVLLIAHNARAFDVPFLLNEFERCSIEIPSNWRFLDTLLLARELVKAQGLKPPTKLNLQALGEYFQAPVSGTAHRAMSDVVLLSYVVQRMTFDLKLTLRDLVMKSFAVTDIVPSKKKKSSS
ncbi:hypothetical protein MLD38_040585 [Melastoma candidum]|nr:hypothetical protein MLD38_040585 [Melastoma candidum]